MTTKRRDVLPKPTDRIVCSPGRLLVSPICVGVTGSPETVHEAFDAGINFFFLSADLHWPLYESTRRGIATLLGRRGVNREDIVVAVASYLDEPLFRSMQFNEVIDAVPGLKHIDVIIMAAVFDQVGFLRRLPALQRANERRHCGSVAKGATFHENAVVLSAQTQHAIDIGYIRYNSAHSRAREELFPFLMKRSPMILFSFKSMKSRPLKGASGLEGVCDLKPSDFYRFALTRPEIDGILCSPSTPTHVRELSWALDQAPLSLDDEQHMINLAKKRG